MRAQDCGGCRLPCDGRSGQRTDRTYPVQISRTYAFTDIELVDRSVDRRVMVLPVERETE